MTEQTKKRLAAGKSLGGRKSIYKPEYCNRLIAYFSVPTYRKVLVKETTKSCKEGMKPEVIREYEERGGDLPFFSAFAIKIGISMDAFYDWCKKYPEFGVAYKICKELQKNHLVQNGIQGNYNPAFGIFTAKNITDMRDQAVAPIVQLGDTHNHHTLVLATKDPHELLQSIIPQKRLNAITV